MSADRPHILLFFFVPCPCHFACTDLYSGLVMHISCTNGVAVCNFYLTFVIKCTK